MPILTAHVNTGHSAAQKRALLEQSTQAVVKALNAPLPSVRILLQEHDAGHVIVAGQAGAPQVLYIVYLIEGRTIELKAALIAALGEAASASLGLSLDDVRVVVRDVPKSDMGVAGGISALAAGR
ncbi:MAG: 4-oxalocrotonate tautomerase [Alcaligenaceae bacterium]|nr:4-oxalocrotonate tautomerase [Alcaligenaceae bacterium]